MRLFHIASKANSEAFFKDGFRNVMGYHHAGQESTGIWVSSEPLNWSQRQYLNNANTLFAIEIPEEVISEFEWVEEGIGLFLLTQSHQMYRLRQVIGMDSRLTAQWNQKLIS